MYIRKVSIKGIAGIREKLEFDLSPADNSKVYSENIETFGIEKNQADFRVLKQVGIIGLNSSGKSSLIKGIQAGMAMLINPIHNRMAFGGMINIFNKGPIEWTFEIVTHVETKTAVARKYMIDFKIENGKIIKEMVSVIEASKTSSKAEEVLYDYDGMDVVCGGKKYTFNNPLSSMFSLMRTGTLNKEIFDKLSKYNDLFTEFTWSEKKALENQIVAPFMVNNLIIPSSPEQLEKLKTWIKIFDNNIVDIFHHSTGEVVLKISSNDETREIKGDHEIRNYLSKGTYEALLHATEMFSALTSKGIYFDDEIDASIHNGLFKAVIELYRANSKSQLIFTTHSTEIFTLNMRLDQINIIKKKGNDISIKRVSDFVDKVDDSVKKIKRAINNVPDTLSLIKAIDAFK